MCGLAIHKFTQSHTPDQQNEFCCLAWIMLVFYPIAKSAIPQRNQNEENAVQCKLTSPTHHSYVI